MTVQIRKDLAWARLGYVPNQAQQRMHRAAARFRVAAAGRRTGKSTGWGRELLPEALKARLRIRWYEESGKRAEHWIVGPEYSDSEKEFRVFYNDCQKLELPFDKPGTYYSARSGDMIISLWGGKFIVRALSAKYPDNLVGEGLHSVTVAEAAKMKESVWSKHLRPALADFNGKGNFGSTPEGRNWFYEIWKLGQDPDRPEWWSGRFPSWLNENIFREETTEQGIARMRALAKVGLLEPGRAADLAVDPEIISMYQDLGDIMFSQEVEARFGQYVGRVFPQWDEEIHCRPLNYDPKLPIYIATDYGWTAPNVALFIQTNVFDDVFVIAEYYETNRTDDEFAKDVLEHAVFGPLARKAVRLYPDPEDPKASNHLASRWKVTLQGGTGGSQKVRLNLVRRWLRVVNLHLPHDHPERRPKLFADSRRCPGLVREMDAWRYPKKGGENPEDKDNHAPEALTRFFGGYFGAKAQGGVRMGRASFER